MKKLASIFLIAGLFNFYSCVSPKSSKENSFAYKYIDQTINIDGVLNEECWNLEKHKFYTRENEINDNVPRFQFLQDKNNVYFGSEYKLPDDINLAGLNKRDVYFQITIVSADTDKKPYSYNAESIDENGNLSGIVTKHCTKAV